MANASNQDLHDQVFQLLMEKIEQDPYPSVTMMDMVEEMLRPDDVEKYASVLMDKIRADSFPSLDLLNRVQSLA
jgi:hypothetical protein